MLNHRITENVLVSFAIPICIEQLVPTVAFSQMIKSFVGQIYLAGSKGFDILIMRCILRILIPKENVLDQSIK